MNGSNILKVISSLLPFLVFYAIIVYRTKGRISRSDFVKTKLCMACGFVLYWIVAKILARIVTPVFVFVGIPLSLIFSYIWVRLSVQRLHDMGQDGIFIFFDFVPIINIVFAILRMVRRGDIKNNDFDSSIDYVPFVKRNGLYPAISCLYKNGFDFTVNEVVFKYHNINSHELYQVSKIALEDDKAVQDFFTKHGTPVATAPEFGQEYKVAFQKSDAILEILQQELHTITIQNEQLMVADDPVFVRINGFNYDLIYSKTATSPLLTDLPHTIHVGDKSYTQINKKDLAALLQKVAK